MRDGSLREAHAAHHGNKIAPTATGSANRSRGAYHRSASSGRRNSGLVVLGHPVPHTPEAHLPSVPRHLHLDRGEDALAVVGEDPELVDFGLSRCGLDLQVLITPAGAPDDLVALLLLLPDLAAVGEEDEPAVSSRGHGELRACHLDAQALGAAGHGHDLARRKRGTPEPFTVAWPRFSGRTAETATATPTARTATPHAPVFATPGVPRMRALAQILVELPGTREVLGLLRGLRGRRPEAQEQGETGERQPPPTERIHPVLLCNVQAPGEPEDEPRGRVSSESSRRGKDSVKYVRTGSSAGGAALPVPPCCRLARKGDYDAGQRAAAVLLLGADGGRHDLAELRLCRRSGTDDRLAVRTHLSRRSLTTITLRDDQSRGELLWQGGIPDDDARLPLEPRSEHGWRGCHPGARLQHGDRLHEAVAARPAHDRRERLQDPQLVHRGSDGRDGQLCGQGGHAQAAQEGLNP